ATCDDACGETFDKVAKILELGYPGGPLIEQIAKKGNPRKIKFGCSNTNNPLDFSFSGIKTAVLYKAADRRPQTVDKKEDIAASFQETAIDVLIKKSFLACKYKKVKRLAVGGGVIANARLREKFLARAKENKITCFFPAKQFCTDNAAMVAGLGYKLFKKGYVSDLFLSADLS
ncbi:MAG: carbamoyltransferase N-terminal domain-containing protein, partial [Candidatus Omnitrophota bacterium]